jgi:hypothetical protein
VSSIDAAVAAIGEHKSLFSLLGYETDINYNAFPGVSEIGDIEHVSSYSAAVERSSVWRLPLDASGTLSTPLDALAGYKVLLNRVNGKGCMMCTPGKYAGAWSSSACVNCASGYFQPGHGSEKCEACGLGQYTSTNTIEGKARGLSTGAVACWTCPSGRYGGQFGQSTCAVCPLGRYAPVSGQGRCAACRRGTFAGTLGAIACSGCPQGRYSQLSGSSTCELCRPGTHMAGMRATACTLCAAGRATAISGMLSCPFCLDGYKAASEGQRTCDACTPGRYVAELSRTGTGATVCIDCAKGHYTPSNARAACTAAPAGHYVQVLGATFAELCGPGSHTVLGQTAAVGPYRPHGHGNKCSRCPAGTYCPHSGHGYGAGAHAPMMCPQGRYGVAGMNHKDCTGPCPAGYRCPPGTAINTWLPCGEGYFCPEGTGSVGTVVSIGHACSQPQDTSGGARWTTCSSQARCTPGNYCTEGKQLPCPAGTSMPLHGANTAVACEATAFVCKVGYFCPTGSSSNTAESCAPAGAAHPERFYCPRGTSSQKLTADYLAGADRGTYTDSESPQSNRKAVKPCLEGSVCWNGVRYPELAFSDATCGGGIYQLKAATKSGDGHTRVLATRELVMPPQQLQLVSRLVDYTGTTISALSASFSLGPMRKTPQCKMDDNVFGLSSTGVLSVKPNISVDVVACPAMWSGPAGSRGTRRGRRVGAGSKIAAAPNTAANHCEL